MPQRSTRPARLDSQVVRRAGRTTWAAWQAGGVLRAPALPVLVIIRGGHDQAAPTTASRDRWKVYPAAGAPAHPPPPTAGPRPRALQRSRLDHGFRALAYVEAGACRLVSRHGHTFRTFDRWPPASPERSRFATRSSTARSVSSTARPSAGRPVPSWGPGPGISLGERCSVVLSFRLLPFVACKYLLYVRERRFDLP